MSADSSSQSGMLFVVATPIGNLDDLTPRARDTLSRVDLIAAEDTRHTATLLRHFGIDTPSLSLHDHNEAARAEQVVQRLRAGENVALVSDAGTPLVSDPGFRLVRAVREAGIRVSPVPGACAAIAALSAAGLPSDRFVFEGFLPPKPAARRTRLKALATESRTLMFYESSHRIVEMLADAAEAFGADRPAVLAREITKRFETLLDGSLAELHERVMADKDQQRGEFVVLVEGASMDEDAALGEGRRLYELLSRELPPARAAKLAAEFSGAPRRALYGG
ncbi:MAG: 16S rRNA (cytidine(1402)-2'-O)-methyltransferase [Rhodanobacteraceae bacterium]|nr:16S rRNA (cytidine(1402)-2'-O)-methyltransferase [Xanthomonadales bacterium]MCP5479056.1 16S rRNA (cytidine(1402)-2'-O)-methyltransferase [Rhodanobacteraceae bacterium]HPF73371.1 16S rRNA (cytidine(1402)-2'-O)-methyltransferase [Xanthomonadaceae bacterium]HRY00558.1 16S rRNA (cytidine(1402)-2'-O)-methyltransferase [Xanthomonadaceae bacterium]